MSYPIVFKQFLKGTIMNKFFVVLAAVVAVALGTVLGEEPVLETPDEVAASVREQARADKRDALVNAATNAAK